MDSLQRETSCCALGLLNAIQHNSNPTIEESFQRWQDMVFRCKCSWEYRLSWIFRMFFLSSGFLESALPFIQLCAKTAEGTSFYSGNFFTSSEFLDYFCELTHLSYQFVLMLPCILTTSRAHGWDKVPQKSTSKSVKHCFISFSLNPGFKAQGPSPPRNLRCWKSLLLLEMEYFLLSEELLA